MYKKLFLIAFSFIIINSGCGNSYTKVSNAAGLVVKELHAGAGHIKVKDYKGTDGNKKSITLMLSGFKDFRNDQSKEMMASTAAVLFIGHLDKADYENYDEVKVQLDINGESYENTFDKKQLADVELYFGTIQNFIDATNENDFAQVKKVVDEKHIVDSSLMSVLTFINKDDSVYGKVNHTNYKGFQFDLMKEDGHPVFVCWVEAQHTNSTTDYKLILSRSTKKIVYIGVNETD